MKFIFAPMIFIGSSIAFADQFAATATIQKKENEVKSQYTTATYKVAEQNQIKFISLLKEAEIVMRSEGLITSSPIFRMRSKVHPQFIMEVLEWVDDTAFDRAQKNPKILALWDQFESIWVDGGFGVSQIPESNLPWAQYEAIH